jgi:hypothetical protein
MKTVLLSVTLLMLAAQSPYEPYSHMPLMSFGSSPAHQNRQPAEIFNQTAFAEDRDTYRDVNTQALVILGTPHAVVAHDIKSGNLEGPPNVNFDGLTGRRTYTYVIEANSPANSTSYQDRFTPSDSGQNLIDTNGETTYNYVTITVPSGGGSQGGN